MNRIFDTNIWDVDEEICIPSASLNADNVHIILELMTTSGLWNYDYLRVQTIPEFRHLQMLYAVLHNNLTPYSTTYREIFKGILDSAPCEGPWSDPFDLSNHALNGWAGPCMLFKGPANTGPHPENDENPWKEYSGYYPGLDYMVYHNLYYLLWKNDLPPYKRNLVCECIIEITEEENINSSLVVKRQFSNYKDYDIPNESYLAHNLNVSSITGKLSVKNDLIICRENPDLQTVLTIEDGATLELFADNTITVREGNKIHITSSGILKAGINEIAGENKQATIILEKDAELIVDDASSVLCYDGLLLVMHEGSKFMLTDSQCIPATNHDEGIFFQADHATITIANSTCVSRSSLIGLNSTFDFSTFQTSDSDVSFVRTGSSEYESVANNCTFSFQGNSHFKLSMPFTWSQCPVTLGAFTHLLIKDGDMKITNQSVLHWQSDDCVIEGTSSRLLFDSGLLHIPANHTFTFTYPTHDCGFLEVANGTENMLQTGANSIFKIAGISHDDLLLKINDFAHLQNANFGAGRIILENCKVDLTNHGAIWTDMRFNATDVNFDYDHDSDSKGEIHLYSNHAVIDQSHFDGTTIYGHWEKARVLQSTFNGSYSGGNFFGGGLYVDGCSFVKSDLISEALGTIYMVENSTFNHGQLYDKSLVEVIVNKCDFSDHNRAGVSKAGGILTLFCNDFTNTPGVKVKDGILNMNSTNRAGYNRFHDCAPPITLDNAVDIDMNDGYNDLSGFSNYCIEGTINIICVNEGQGQCTMTVDAIHNYWGDPNENSPNPGIYSQFPESSEMHLQTSYVPGGICGYDPQEHVCYIDFIDQDPVAITACPGKAKISVKNTFLENSSQELVESSKWIDSHGVLKDLITDTQNPIIVTSSFDHIALDSALVFAAMQMEIYDSLGSDAASIALFHEILLDSLDQNNSDIKRKMNWGRNQMKAAVENMFFNENLLAINNQSSFETPVQQYVDILNLMTQTELTDSTYRLQFYLELDKGQLFRTIDKPEITQQVFVHLDDCQLDSLEQSVLNQWRQQVDLDISLRDQFLIEHIALDSLDISVDTSSYTSPITYTSSNYYFGLWIDAPNSVTFVSCDDNPMYRSMQAINPKTGVYPNPAGDRIFLHRLASNQSYQIVLSDMSGRSFFNRKLNTTNTADIPIEIPREVADGSYLLQIRSAEISEQHLVVIRKK